MLKVPILLAILERLLFKELLMLMDDEALRFLKSVLTGVNKRSVGDFNPHYECSPLVKLELKERIEQIKESSGKGGVFASKSEFSEEMMDIRKDLVTIHGEMVLLKNYSALNFAGIVKILKKYDKRTGGLLRLQFTQLVLHQPFFTTESLTRLVHECEANLELLFPLEAEVIESTPQGKLNPASHNTVNRSQEESPSNLGEGTMDIYRSTLAAMKAIRGLQKASSTSNPLSFSTFLKNQDDDSGAITENSASNSSATLQKGKEIDKEDAQSVQRH